VFRRQRDVGHRGRPPPPKLGAEGKDDGGKLDRERPMEPGTDIGFGLWDVAHRRRPPRPAVNRDGPPDGEPLPPDKKQP
jgi:hypothetical protein